MPLKHVKAEQHVHALVNAREVWRRLLHIIKKRKTSQRASCQGHHTYDCNSLATQPSSLITGFDNAGSIVDSVHQASKYPQGSRNRLTHYTYATARQARYKTWISYTWLSGTDILRKRCQSTYMAVENRYRAGEVRAADVHVHHMYAPHNLGRADPLGHAGPPARTHSILSYAASVSSLSFPKCHVLKNKRQDDCFYFLTVPVDLSL